MLINSHGYSNLYNFLKQEKHSGYQINEIHITLD